MSEKVPKGWKRVKLGDFIKIKHGFAFKGKNITDEETNAILVTPGNFNIGGGFKYSKFKYFNGNYSDDYVLKEGDIVVVMTDLSKEADILGYSAKIPKINGKVLLHNQRIGLLEFISSNISRDFIYWLLRTYDYHWYCVSSASGTSVMHTSPSRIEAYEFNLPPLPEQKAIASVLSSIDDKIDLLHRQNQTLEQMAQTLFRKWFIEDVKEDWEEKPLDKIANFLNGLACQKYPPKNNVDKLPVLKIKELKNGFTKNSDWATSEVPPEYIIVNGDVIFSWSGSLIVKIWNGEKCVLNQHLFKVTSEKYPKWFYYFWIKFYLQEFTMIAESKATTMGHIKREDLSKALVLVPPNKDLVKMDKKISPLMDKIISINNQIRTLENLRDTLLPKLMSGKIKIG